MTRLDDRLEIVPSVEAGFDDDARGLELGSSCSSSTTGPNRSPWRSTRSSTSAESKMSAGRRRPRPARPRPRPRSPGWRPSGAPSRAASTRRPSSCARRSVTSRSGPCPGAGPCACRIRRRPGAASRAAARTRAREGLRARHVPVIGPVERHVDLQPPTRRLRERPEAEVIEDAQPAGDARSRRCRPPARVQVEDHLLRVLGAVAWPSTCAAPGPQAGPATPGWPAVDHAEVDVALVVAGVDRRSS